MTLISNEGSTGIGTATLVCGWLFGLLALVTIILMIWSRRIKRTALGTEDYILIVATGISIVLTAQTSWAVASEGQGSHIQSEPPSEVGMVAKVCPFVCYAMLV